MECFGTKRTHFALQAHQFSWVDATTTDQDAALGNRRSPVPVKGSAGPRDLYHRPPQTAKRPLG